MSAAVTGIADARFGAGDLCWSQDGSKAEAALVLEPECGRDDAMQMVPMLQVAIGDAIGAMGPPTLAFGLRWPATLLANGGKVGRVFASLPPGTGPDDVPDWLVVGFSVALSLPETLQEAPGAAAHLSALHEEGAGNIEAMALIDAVARHFLAWLDTRQHEGFAPIQAAYRALLDAEPLNPEELVDAMGREE